MKKEEKIKEEVLKEIEKQWAVDQDDVNINFDGDNYFIRVTNDKELEGSDFIDSAISLARKHLIEEIERINGAEKDGIILVILRKEWEKLKKGEKS
jgi:hypothetical protein